MTEVDWNSWRRAYLNWFEAAGTDNPLKYLSTFDHTGTIEEVKQKAKTAETLSSLQKIGLHGFERGTVNRNQDIVIVNINPKLALSPEGPVESDLNYRLGTNDAENTEQSRTEGNRAGLKWLLTHNDETAGYVDCIFQELSNADKIPDTFSTPTKTQIPELTDHLYYTNWFKYATIDDTVLKNWLKNEGGLIDSTDVFDDDSTLLDRLESAEQIPNAMLEAELAAVDPELIIVSGKLPWTRFFHPNNRVTPESEHRVSSTTYKVHGRPYRYNEPTGVDAKVIPLYHTSKRGYMNASRYLPSDDPVEETKTRLSTSLQA